jgi:hypothetical protein
MRKLPRGGFPSKRARAKLDALQCQESPLTIHQSQPYPHRMRDEIKLFQLELLLPLLEGSYDEVVGAVILECGQRNTVC